MFPTFWSPPAVSLCAPLIEMSLQSKRRRLLMSHSPMMVMVFFSGHNWKGASTSTFEWEAFEYHWYMKWQMSSISFVCELFQLWYTLTLVPFGKGPLWSKRLCMICGQIWFNLKRKSNLMNNLINCLGGAKLGFAQDASLLQFPQRIRD